MRRANPSSRSRVFSRLPRLAAAAVAAAAALACVPAVAQGQSGQGEVIAAGRILVKPRAGMPEAALGRLLREQGAGAAQRVGRSELRVVQLTRGQERALVARLARHPHIEFAEVDRLVPLHASNDPFLGSQWHLPKIGAPSAWADSTGQGIKIAILDTGVDGSHPDLKDRMVPGYNFYDNNTNTSDVQGHGTAVAGSAAATLNNGTGVASVAGKAWIMPVRIAQPDGYAYFSTIAQGLTWAADQGARVANISYGVTGSASVRSAAAYMKSKGGLVVVSAGNTGKLESTTGTDTMITVSATDKNDARSSWSSYGGYVTLSAPGAGIYTTNRGGGYGSWNGTSFSAPVTAGVVGLMMAANPALSAAEVEQRLLASAVDLGAVGRDIEYGWGRVDAAAAVAAAVATVTPADTEAPRVAIASPGASSTVSGLVAVDVTASDNVGVARVDLRVNGKTVASDSVAPFAFSWDSATVANGMAELRLVAVDEAGNVGESAPVVVNVANAAAADTTPPVVLIVNPKDGATVSGTVKVSLSASDDSGSAGITQELLLNGTRVATATGGTLSYTWNTRRVAKGSYTFQAVARDAAGNAASTSVTVRR